MTSTVVVGVFDNINHVETAIKQLRDIGVEKDAISMVATAITGNQTVHGIAQGADPAGNEAATTGVFQLLTGSALAWIPSGGAVFSLGPISAEVSAALTGAGSHAVPKTLAGCGIPTGAVDRYMENLRRGEYLIVVTDTDDAAMADHLLADNGATAVDRY